MKLTTKMAVAGFAALVLIAAIAVIAFRTMVVFPRNDYSKAQLKAFYQASSVELLSISPADHDYEVDPSAPDEVVRRPIKTPLGSFHEYPILGAVRISDAGELASIRQAVADLETDGERWSGGVSACFLPRHCLRVSTASGTAELLICYECTQVEICTEGRRVGAIYFNRHGAAHAATPDRLNALLKKHSIPLASPPRHEQ